MSKEERTQSGNINEQKNAPQKVTLDWFKNNSLKDVATSGAGDGKTDK